MKKVLVFVTILTLVASFGLFAAAQAEAKSQSNEVTLYYSHSADWTDPLIKEFQDRTGIKVNLVGAPTGELVARIRAEKDNPLGDLLWGGGSDSYQVIIDLLEPYEHAHMNQVLAETRDETAGMNVHRWSSCNPETRFRRRTQRLGRLLN